MNTITKMFEEYGFTVEPFGKEGSYIASNEKYCVPFKVYGTENFPEVIAVTFHSHNKAELMEAYNDAADVYRDRENYQLKIIPCAGLCNNNHRNYEIEGWLMQVSRER